MGTATHKDIQEVAKLIKNLGVAQLVLLISDILANKYSGYDKRMMLIIKSTKYGKIVNILDKAGDQIREIEKRK